MDEKASVLLLNCCCPLLGGSSAVVYTLLVVAPIVRSLFSFTVLCVVSSFASSC